MRTQTPPQNPNPETRNAEKQSNTKIKETNNLACFKIQGKGKPKLNRHNIAWTKKTKWKKTRIKKQ